MKSIGMQYNIITIIKYHLLQLLIYYHTIVYHNLFAVNKHFYSTCTCR